MWEQIKIPLVIGAGLSLCLYFLLPGASILFFELYHLTGLEFVYWFYSGTKLASVFYPRWEFYELSVIVAGLLLALLLYWRKERQAATAEL